MKRASRGVTLLELLIAVSLVGLVSLGILMAIRVGFGAMEKSNARLMENRRVAGAQQILEQQIAGFMAVQGDCVETPDRPPTRMSFFQGDIESMRFVSSYSLQEAARGMPRLLEFQVIPGENREGVRLVVNEHLFAGSLSTAPFCFGLGPDPITGAPVPRFPPVQVGPRSFVLADKLAFCRFMYREPAPPPEFERWTPRWVRADLPMAVRVEMAPLRPDPSRVQLISLTAPIRVTKDPMVTYEN
ncbi:MAG TPA: prepilin-type N-terminal cleavage/methylation domain-containing protein [Bryobacteraceae bacterium]|nr:prepilin-type N-terminal cleavage/methylation domain-containing protein [Bryobacteraceae bacterium]